MRIKRLHSFTILELLTVMLISSILIALIYIGIQQMSTLEQKFQRDTNQMLLWEEFESIIQRDAFEAEEIELKEDVLMFILPNKLVRYEFNKKKINRIGIKNKEYPLVLLNTSGKFQNKNIVDGVCDEIVLTFDSEKSIYLDKKYSAKQLMNIEN